MLLVDRVAGIEPGVSIVCHKAISGAEPCYAHMTPGLPGAAWAYPTSLLLESFAQSAAILWMQSPQVSEMADGRVLIFLAARRCRFQGFAYPGDVLRHEVRIGALVHDHVFVEGETFVGHRRIAVVDEIVAAIADRRTLMDGSRTATAAGPPTSSQPHERSEGLHHGSESRHPS
jgi:3-hydroxyacyl-[acyl-carrier-protein] dehydratase